MELCFLFLSRQTRVSVKWVSEWVMRVCFVHYLLLWSVSEWASEVTVQWSCRPSSCLLNISIGLWQLRSNVSEWVSEWVSGGLLHISTLSIHTAMRSVCMCACVHVCMCEWVSECVHVHNVLVPHSHGCRKKSIAKLLGLLKVQRRKH
jgi:hypothetical protein